MQQKVAQYIADFLVEHGVTHNFSVTGGGAMHLNDALGHKEGLQSVYNHNEQGSAIAAEAYARLTGRIASLCVTSGPGGTNAITGVMGGWLDSIPMFVLSGQVKRETTIWAVPELKLRQLGDQEFDIVHTVANMTKYCVMVTEPNDIAYHLEKAWFLANEGRKGPIWPFRWMYRGRRWIPTSSATLTRMRRDIPGAFRPFPRRPQRRFCGVSRRLRHPCCLQAAECAPPDRTSCCWSWWKSFRFRWQWHGIPEI